MALDEKLTIILKHPHSIEAVISIPQMWRNINQVIEIIEGHHLEIRISRALAMWTVLSLHQWVKKAIDSAQSRTSKGHLDQQTHPENWDPAKCQRTRRN